MTPVRLERMSRENVEYWLLHEMHRKAQDVDASLIRQALERIAPVTDADTEKAHLSLLTFHWEHDAEIAVRRRRRHRAHATMLVVLLLTLMTAVGFALGSTSGKWRINGPQSSCSCSSGPTKAHRCLLTTHLGWNTSRMFGGMPYMR